MDRADLDSLAARKICNELDQLIGELAARELPASSWYGKFDLTRDAYEKVNRGYGYEPLPESADDARFPWFLYWEIAWLVLNNDYRAGDRLLDLGGSSSLFSYYMAHKGLEVVTVDLQGALVENANEVARRAGWKLTNLHADMRELPQAEPYDHITSVCVYEHIPVSGRVEVSARVPRLLKEGGSLSVTFDYLNPSRAAAISSPEDVERQFVAPTSLEVRGNRRFEDNGKRYLLAPFFHPSAWRRGWKPLLLARREFGLRDLLKTKRSNDYTFGALFLRKRADPNQPHPRAASA